MAMPKRTGELGRTWRRACIGSRSGLQGRRV